MYLQYFRCCILKGCHSEEVLIGGNQAIQFCIKSFPRFFTLNFGHAKFLFSFRNFWIIIHQLHKSLKLAFGCYFQFHAYKYLIIYIKQKKITYDFSIFYIFFLLFLKRKYIKYISELYN